MTTRRISVLAVLLAAMSIAACANGDATAPGAAPAPSAAAGSAAAPSASVPSAAASAPGAGPSAGRPAAGPQTLSGTVRAGVEPGCLLLGDHLLVFDDPAMRAEAKAGTTVTVTGEAQPSMMTTCQQGTPFVVASVR